MEDPLNMQRDLHSSPPGAGLRIWNRFVTTMGVGAAKSSLWWLNKTSRIYMLAFSYGIHSYIHPICILASPGVWNCSYCGLSRWAVALVVSPGSARWGLSWMALVWQGLPLIVADAHCWLIGWGSSAVGLATGLSQSHGSWLPPNNCCCVLLLLFGCTQAFSGCHQSTMQTQGNNQKKYKHST